MKILMTVIGLLMVVCLLVPLSCAPALQPSQPTLKPTNSEPASRIAELEARIRQLEAENQRLLAENRQLEAENQRLLAENRQLEAENQRLLAENRQVEAENQRLVTENRELSSENQRLLTENRELSDNLAKVTTQIQAVQSLVNSPSYTFALSGLTEIQSKTGELAYFAEGLPDLPPLPPGLTPSKIEQVLGMARVAYDVIYRLPPLPLFIPELAELERQRQTFLEIFKFVEDLRDLPQFLNNAESLEDLRSRIEAYLADIQNTTSYAGDIMQQVRDAIQP